MQTVKLAVSRIDSKLAALGLVSNGKAITFTEFKKVGDVHQYGRGKNKLYVIYLGSPKENLFAFYPPQTTKKESLEIAYQYFIDIATTEMKQEYLDENVMWGNCGIPISYGSLRVQLELSDVMSLPEAERARIGSLRVV